jgi:hypothetical protein
VAKKRLGQIAGAKLQIIFVFLCSNEKKVRKKLEHNRKMPIFAALEH